MNIGNPYNEYRIREDELAHLDEEAWLNAHEEDINDIIKRVWRRPTEKREALIFVFGVVSGVLITLLTLGSVLS